MAEFVQLRLEENLPVLKELQNAGVFTDKEIKLILKKLTQFEYRMQRNIKKKDDYLKFIQYQVNLLRLLQMRRKSRNIRLDYSVADYRIIQKIFFLFRKAVFKYNKDEKLWMTAINFARQVNLKNSVSRLYSSWLQFQGNSNPDLWLAAALYEFDEHDSPDTARSLILRGLRFHPKSKQLLLAHFRLELNYAKLKCLEESVTMDMSMRMSEHQEDVIMKGDVALLVYKHAMDTIPDAAFAVEFLKISQTFTFTTSIQQQIYSDLEKMFAKSEEAKGALARRPRDVLCFGGQWVGDFTRSVELECYFNMEKAVKELPTEKMWFQYIEFCKECVETKSNEEIKSVRKEHLADIMKRAAKEKCLATAYYMPLVDMLPIDEQSEMLELATTWFPNNVDFWKRRLSHEISKNHNDSETIPQLLNSALEATSADAYSIWDMSISWHMARGSTDEVTKLFERGLEAFSKATCKIKTRYLKWIAVKHGIKSARNLYKRLWCMHPISLDFFYAACDIELAQPKPQLKRILSIMENGSMNFGKSSVDFWIRYLTMLKRFPTNIEKAGHVHWQAVKSLDPSLVDEYITYHSLLMKDIV